MVGELQWKGIVVGGAVVVPTVDAGVVAFIFMIKLLSQIPKIVSKNCML